MAFFYTNSAEGKEEIKPVVVAHLKTLDASSE